MSVLVVGAGPAGLAIAACLKRRGVTFDLVDRRGEVGGAFNLMYDGITLFSPARYTSLPGLKLHCAGEYVTAVEYRDYLHAYANHHGLKPRKAEIVSIVRSGHEFTVQFAGESQTRGYAVVVVATGMFDFPIWPNISGLRDADPLTPDPSPPSTGERGKMLHARHWPGPAAYQGKRLLILGGASGAVEIAEECARANLHVVVSTRSGVKISSQRFLGRDVHDYAYVLATILPKWSLGSFCDERPTLPATDLGFAEFQTAGLIDVRGPVARFDGTTAHFADGRTEEFDVVVAATGYRFDMPFLPPEVKRTFAGHPFADQGECRSWPGLFFIGIPCIRSLISEFLRGIAQDAPALADRVASR